MSHIDQSQTDFGAERSWPSTSKKSQKASTFWTYWPSYTQPWTWHSRHTIRYKDWPLHTNSPFYIHNYPYISIFCILDTSTHMNRPFHREWLFLTSDYTSSAPGSHQWPHSTACGALSTWDMGWEAAMASSLLWELLLCECHGAFLKREGKFPIPPGNSQNRIDSWMNLIIPSKTSNETVILFPKKYNTQLMTTLPDLPLQNMSLGWCSLLILSK